MDTTLITLVVLINVLLLGVLIWKAAWLMRKIRAYPMQERRAGGDNTVTARNADTAPVASVVHEHGSDHGLGGETDAHEQTDKQQ